MLLLNDIHAYFSCTFFIVLSVWPVITEVYHTCKLHTLLYFHKTLWGVTVTVNALHESRVTTPLRGHGRCIQVYTKLVEIREFISFYPNLFLSILTPPPPPWSSMIFEYYICYTQLHMRGSRKFCQRVFKIWQLNFLLFFFSLMRGARIKIPL